MASYATIPAAEDAPLAAPAKSNTPNRKAVATIAAICLTAAVAGFQAPSAVKALAFATTGNGDLPAPSFSQDVQICLASDDSYCLGVPGKGNNGLNTDASDLTIFSESTSKQGIQRFTYEEYSPCIGCRTLSRLRFESKSGDYNGCVALYGRNNGYSNGGSPIQMQKCILQDNQGGQRQDVQIPGAGRKDAKGKLDFYLTSNLCIGSVKGSLSDNKHVYSDQCRTEYIVKRV